MRQTAGRPTWRSPYNVETAPTLAQQAHRLMVARERRFFDRAYPFVYGFAAGLATAVGLALWVLR